MFQLDYGDHRPLYEQIKEKFIRLIIGGILKENDKIPSVRELAVALAINPNTIQKAYRDLESDGYIYSQRAKGSYVAPIDNVQRKNDSADVMCEYEKIVQKLKFLGADYDELLKILDNEYAKGSDDL